VNESEPANAGGIERVVEIHFLIDGAQVRNFEVLGLLKRRGWNNQLIGA